MFETVSFHIVKPCDKKCKFCYATFDDMVVKQMSLEDAKKVVFKLKQAGLQKITFAGGEPLLYKYIKEIIIYAKEIGLTTSIITNGSRLNKEWLVNMKPYLDWVGLSIDSFDDEINIQSGRFISKKDRVNYHYLLKILIRMNYKIKINTVVHNFNQNDTSMVFVLKRLLEIESPFKIDRWKIFQTLRVEGQNDLQFENIAADEISFIKYVNYIKESFKDFNINVVAEDNEAMTGSYLLVDPQGRLFENSKGKHTYSKSLINNDIDDCLKQIDLDRDMFVKRGGIYNW